ncbi:hypothetical protein AS888_05080 [Peribacillus simplex]|uniref:Secreted peptide n=1 Tax=Peribacillus simplex TaxID=1478 RepID=A0A109N1Q4_9BACI|nr:hypothetical protein AS888_05080 [Peribacillus simplex]
MLAALVVSCALAALAAAGAADVVADAVDVAAGVAVVAADAADVAAGANGSNFLTVPAVIVQGLFFWFRHKRQIVIHRMKVK